MIRRLLSALALMLFATGAQAQWKEASTPNFLIYSQGSEADLRAFAEKVERFDWVLRRYHHVTAGASPNRLRVVLLPSRQDVAALAGAAGSGVAGFYVPDARAMMLVGSRNETRVALGSSRGDVERAGLSSEAVLLHEYTHHFMFQYFPATYPSWYSEGWAEFWGATQFEADGAVEVGHPANHRFGSFVANRWLPLSRLLTAQSYADVPELDLLYAEGWLLVRYAWEHPERQRQLQQYLNLINRGATYAAAAQQAFGDVGQLNNELRDYSGRGRFSVLHLPFRHSDAGELHIRTLGAAEQALFPLELELAQGVSAREFAAFAARARQAAGRFPDDPYALRLLMEVERTANDASAAQRAVDRLLAVAPDDPRGLMYKALLDIDRLRQGAGQASAWDHARAPLLRAATLAPNDPLIQEAVYDSYAVEGRLPPEQAQGNLYRAMELAPSDPRLRYKVAADFERRDMIPEAIAIIRPQAYIERDRSSESAGDRQRRLAQEDQRRRAGRPRTESAREMLNRLNGRLGPQGSNAPAAPAPSARQPGH